MADHKPLKKFRSKLGESWAGSLQIEEILFTGEAAGIASQRAISSDDSVAGNDDGERIFSVG